MTQRLLVVDTETTGVLNKDRVIEIAAITVDASTWKVVDEFETLVNPERDVGPTSIHGITPTMIEAAPTFEEIAADLARRLNGATLVAHNLDFDARFLENEYDRLGIKLDAGYGFCTLRQTKKKLATACAEEGVPLHQTHRAYTDALATTLLAAKIAGNQTHWTPARIDARSMKDRTRTLRRPDSDDIARSRISHVTDFGRLTLLADPELVYLDTLDHVLADQVLTIEERQGLREMGALFGLSDADRDRLHRHYLNMILEAAHRDHMISDSEHALMTTIRDSLDVSEFPIPEPTLPVAANDLPPKDALICFTGEASYNGQKLSRPEMENVAVRNGYTPAPNVTKGCRLLVAADASSGSGKARQARRYGIPIMTTTDFLDACQVKPH